MNTQKEALEAAVRAEIEGDATFQSSLEGKTEDEKVQLIGNKRNEVLAKKAPEWFENMKKHETIANDQRQRAEKAEAEGKGKGKDGEDDKDKDKDKDKGKDEPKDLSSTEVIALVSAQITHADDIEEVKKAAKLLGKTITEAINDPMVKGILQRNGEYRKSQDAANIGKDGKKGNEGAAPSEVLKRASEGKIPDAGSPEAESLYKARRGIK